MFTEFHDSRRRFRVNMADRGTLIASLLTEEPLKIRQNQGIAMKTSLYGVSMSLADTECAQILLELSKSTVPEIIQSPNRSPSSTISADETHLFEYRDGAISPRTRNPWAMSPRSKRTSLLKRQMESPAEIVYREELVKRVKLDHNYSWSGEDKLSQDHTGSDPFKRYCESLKSEKRVHDTPKVEASTHESNTTFKSSPLKDRKSSNKHEEKTSNGHIKSDTFTRLKAPALEAQSICLPANSSQSSIVIESKNALLEVKKENTPNVTPEGENLASKENINTTTCTVSKSPTQNDAKFHNFELLLKCLSKNELGENYTSDKEETNSEKNCEDLDRDELSNDFDGIMGEYGYSCTRCFKKFNKKRYLTKHLRRMHPGTDVPELQSDTSVSCPNCGNSVSRKDFKKHSTLCNVHVTKSKKQLEMDLANCQFCGIRMRRHMLVKHLAREHCIDNAGENPDCDEEMYSLSSDSSDSGSPSFAGKIKKESVSCQLCGVPILKTKLCQHFQEKHVVESSLPRKVSCQLCGIELPKVQLMQHLSEVHCVDQNGKLPLLEGNETLVKPKCQCKQSMLQRFLSDNASTVEGKESGQTFSQTLEPCQSCMSPLYKAQKYPGFGNTDPESNKATAYPDILEEAARLAEITATETQEIENQESSDSPMPFDDSEDFYKSTFQAHEDENYGELDENVKDCIDQAKNVKDIPSQLQEKTDSSPDQMPPKET